MKRHQSIIAVLICLLGPAYALAADAPLPRCGLLIDPNVASEPAAALFESSFPQEPGIVALDRTEIDKVLREQQLQAMFSPDALSQRSAFGKIVKADLLIMIRRGHISDGAAGAPLAARSIEFVVSETHHGLRLVTATLPVNGAVAADAAQFTAAFHQALARDREPLQTIVAVPPFVSLNLTHDEDYLQDVYSRLMQETLSRQPGVLVVEIAEAKALADEIALAGGDPIRREVPFYVTGQFRHEGVGANLHLALTIDLARAGKKLDHAAFEKLAPEKTPDALRTAALGLLKTMGKPAAGANDVSIEAKELAFEAETFSRLGEWHEARTLAEACLLLDPKNARIHGIAFHALNELAMAAGGTPGQVGQKDIPAALAYFRDSLSHLEPYIVGTKFTRNILGPAEDFPLDGYWRTVRSEVTSNFNPPRQRWIDADLQARETVLNAMHRKAEAKIDDQTIERFWNLLFPLPREPLGPGHPTFTQQEIDETSAQGRDLRLALLKEFSYRKRSAFFPHLLLEGCPVETTDPQWQAFIAEVKKIPNPEIVKAWDDICYQDARYKSQLKAQANIKPAKPPVVATADAEIVFEKLDLPSPPHWAIKNVSNKIIGCLPVGDGVDLFWTRCLIFTMKQKGEFLEHVIGGAPPWPPDESDTSRDFPSHMWLTPTGACFDGQFAWFIITTGPAGSTPDDDWNRSPMGEPLSYALIAFDVKRNVIYWNGRKQGLPPGAHAITALAPGKVCVAGELARVGGNVGRVWCAVASVRPDLEGHVPLKIIYEARELPPTVGAGGDGSSPENTSKAYPIEQISALSAPVDGRPADAPDKPAETHWPRVLVQRLGQQYFLLDPNNGKIEKVNCPCPVAYAAWVDGGNIFWRGNFGGKPAVSRSTGPNLIPDRHPCKVKGDGKFLTDLQGTGFLFSGSECLVSGQGELHFRKLRGDSLKMVDFDNFFRSNHYGLIVIEPLKRELFAVEFPKGLPEAKPGLQ